MKKDAPGLIVLKVLNVFKQNIKKKLFRSNYYFSYLSRSQGFLCAICGYPLYFYLRFAKFRLHYLFSNVIVSSRYSESSTKTKNSKNLVLIHSHCISSSR